MGDRSLTGLVRFVVSRNDKSGRSETTCPYNEPLFLAQIGYRVEGPTMRTAAAGLMAAVTFCINLAGCSSQRRVLTVAAAADLKFALDDILTEFRREQPDIDVKVSYGSSGSFYRQLSESAPFDLFFSADSDYPRRLIQEHRAIQESEFTYAVGHVVLWVPRTSPIDVEKLHKQALLHPAVKKIAIANPDYAPYGRAAQKALQALGVYDQIKKRIVQGKNVAQAAQYVETGAADIGIIGLSQAVSPALRTRGRFWEIPQKYYPQMQQAGVILSGATEREAAKALRAFVLGAEGKAILRRYGFTLPGK
jgi:molybdate transport system substrate-binding protein